MAKKTTRKPNVPQETLERARRELARTGEVPAASAGSSNGAASVEAAKPKTTKPKTKTGPAPKPVATVDLRRDYAYVIADLQQMALLAGGILITLIVLSFFI